MTRDEMIATIKDAGKNLDYSQSWAHSTAIFRAGMAAAADVVEDSWRDGYRGEVNAGFKYVILGVANKLGHTA